MGERLITLTLIALAAYRAAHLIAVEDGPYDVARRLRIWARARWEPVEVAPGVWEEHWVARGLTCPLCVSFWLTLPAGLVAPSPSRFPLYWLACAGLVLVTHKAVDR